MSHLTIMRPVISTKIQTMHGKDPAVYPFADWGSPQGKDVSLYDATDSLAPYLLLLLSMNGTFLC